MLFYRAALPLSSRTLTFVSGIIRRHRAAIGSPWRKLNPGQQALLVLVYLRKGETFAEVAAGFEVGTTTAWRYVNETVALLAARAPKLRTGGPGREEGRVRLRGPGRDPDPDRPGRRGPALLLRQAQEARDEPAGHRQPRRATSCGCPGRCPARSTTRRPSGSGASWHELEAAGLVTLADKGYQGSTYAKIPYRGKNKPESQKEANRAHAKLRVTRRARERPAQDLEHPPQAPLLPLARRPARQGHPRIADPRGKRRMKKVHSWPVH